MWDVEKSGEVERLLALASCNQQFLSHGLYAGVVRQLQVVDTGHYWGEEIIRVFRGLERLSHDRQRGIQAPETWDQPEASDRFSPDEASHFTHSEAQKTAFFSLKCDPCLDTHDECVCEMTHLQQAAWGSLWQTVERVSAAQHQSCSTPQTGTLQHGCKSHERTNTSNVLLEAFCCGNLAKPQ